MSAVSSSSLPVVRSSTWSPRHVEHPGRVDAARVEFRLPLRLRRREQLLHRRLHCVPHPLRVVSRRLAGGAVVLWRQRNQVRVRAYSRSVMTSAGSESGYAGLWSRYKLEA